MTSQVKGLLLIILLSMELETLLPNKRSIEDSKMMKLLVKMNLILMHKLRKVSKLMALVQGLEE